MPIVRKFRCIDGNQGNPVEANVTENGGRYGLTLGYDRKRDGIVYARWDFNVIPTSIRTAVRTLYRHARIKGFALEPVR